MFQILLAGVLGIPTIILLLGIVPILGLLSMPSLYFLLHRPPSTNEGKNKDYKRPHQVIIVGGSTGIGFEIAKECVLRKVPIITILARDEKKLNHAEKELEQLVKTLPPNGKNPNENKIQIRIVSVDVTSYSALETTATNLELKQDEHIVLWNCAGFTVPGEFLKVPVETFQDHIQTNQLGTIYTIRAFLPHMVQGCIVLTSSAAGQVGLYGYSMYSPTKFALQGFAQCLHAEMMESHPHVSIQLAFPVDTDTPGYHEEMKTKPEVTKIMCESGGKVMPAEQTARSMVKAAFCKYPSFQAYLNFEGWMLANLTCGMSPVTNLFDAMTQISMTGLFRLISLFIVNDWWNTIRNYSPPPPTTTATTTKTTATVTIGEVKPLLTGLHMDRYDSQ